MLVFSSSVLKGLESLNLGVERDLTDFVSVARFLCFCTSVT
jgi:hypothetical protein